MRACNGRAFCVGGLDSRREGHTKPISEKISDEMGTVLR
jgi:hypothetical protein